PVGDVPGRIEEQYRERIASLPAATRQLLVVAAADPMGDPGLVWLAARTLGIGPDAAEAAQAEGLLEIRAGVRFRPPLVRSAAYGAASAAERRAAHGALAEVTDGDTDPDRACWHRAHATVPPDEDVAAALIACAGGAQRRGGAGAAAAFLE